MEGKTRRTHEETLGDIIMDLSQEEVISHCQSQKSEETENRNKSMTRQ